MPDILTPVIESDSTTGRELTYPEALAQSAAVYREELDVLAEDDDRRGEVQLRAEAFERAAAQWDACPYAPQGGCTAEDCTSVPVGGWAHPHGPDEAATKSLDEQVDAAVDAYGMALVHPATGTVVPVGVQDGTMPHLDDLVPNTGLLASARERTGATKSPEPPPEPRKIPHRLVYADELYEGQRIVYRKPCGRNHTGLNAVFGGAPHEHDDAVAVIMRIRDGEGPNAYQRVAILMSEDGEQFPMQWNVIEPVAVAVEG